MPNTIESILHRIFTTNNNCWEIDIKPRKDGYRQIRFNGRKVYLHKLIKEHYHGVCPNDLLCDHICRNRGCCNPEHLEYVTAAENTNRSPIHPFVTKPQEAKTHCPLGHPLLGNNVYRRQDRPGRECRACRRARQQRLWKIKTSKC